MMEPTFQFTLIFFLLYLCVCMLTYHNFSQVGHLGVAYQEWVHQPIVSKEGPRFFESDFWEVHSLLINTLRP